MSAPTIELERFTHDGQMSRGAPNNAIHALLVEAFKSNPEEQWQLRIPTGLGGTALSLDLNLISEKTQLGAGSTILAFDTSAQPSECDEVAFPGKGKLVGLLSVNKSLNEYARQSSQDAAKQTLYNNIIGSITLEDEIVLEPVTYDKVDDMAQYLVLLAVHSDYQNRMNGRLETGVGSSLLQDHLSRLGDEGISTDCSASNLSWYTRHGFRPIWTGKHGGRTPAGDEHSWRQFRMYYGPSADQSAGQG